MAGPDEYKLKIDIDEHEFVRKLEKALKKVRFGGAVEGGAGRGSGGATHTQIVQHIGRSVEDSMKLMAEKHKRTMEEIQRREEKSIKGAYYRGLYSGGGIPTVVGRMMGGRQGANIGRALEMFNKVMKDKENNKIPQLVRIAGFAVAAAGIAGLGKAIIDSSPLLQAFLDIGQTALQFFLRPIGDFIGFFLKPFVLLMLKYAVKWYKWAYDNRLLQTASNAAGAVETTGTLLFADTSSPEYKAAEKKATKFWVDLATGSLGADAVKNEITSRFTDEELKKRLGLDDAALKKWKESTKSQSDWGKILGDWWKTNIENPLANLFQMAHAEVGGTAPPTDVGGVDIELIDDPYKKGRTLSDNSKKLREEWRKRMERLRGQGEVSGGGYGDGVGTGAHAGVRQEPYLNAQQIKANKIIQAYEDYKKNLGLGGGGTFADLIKERRGLEGKLKNPTISDSDKEIIQKKIDELNNKISDQTDATEKNTARTDILETTYQNTQNGVEELNRTMQQITEKMGVTETALAAAVKALAPVLAQGAFRKLLKKTVGAMEQSGLFEQLSPYAQQDVTDKGLVGWIGANGKTYDTAAEAILNNPGTQVDKGGNVSYNPVAPTPKPYIKAMAGGGIINEPIFGIGQSGRHYRFGEKGPETVTPGTGGVDMPVYFNFTINGVKDAYDIESKLRPLIMKIIRDETARRGKI